MTVEMTLVEQIQAKMQRRDELRAELVSIEQELIDAGALMAVTVANKALLRRRGRDIHGDSVRARILSALSDGREWNTRDIQCRIPVSPFSVAAQLSRMAREGDIKRVRQGWYTANVDEIQPAAGESQ